MNRSIIKINLFVITVLLLTYIPISFSNICLENYTYKKSYSNITLQKIKYLQPIDHFNSHLDIAYAIDSIVDEPDVNVILAIIFNESSFNPNAKHVNSKQSIDYGLMQINSYWHNFDKNKIHDIYYNIRYGYTFYNNLHIHHKTIYNALMRYNNSKAYANKVSKTINKLNNFERTLTNI